MKPKLFITRNEYHSPKTKVNDTMPSRTFLPNRFLDRGYAIVNVKNIAIAEPVKVTNIEIKNARAK